MALQGRNGKLGMEKPTLESPDIIVEDERPSKEGNEERPTSYVFVKTFSNPDGSRYYHFTSVTVSKEGKEVVISNQEKSANRISRLLQTGKVAWINSKFSSHPKSRVEESVPVSETNRPTSTDNQSALLGINSPEPLEELKRQAGREGGHILILPSKEEAGGLSSRTSDLSLEGKDTNNSVNPQEKSKENDKFSFGNTFYSPAMKAVEGVKQEKATGEQWIKMLEKNGGLKKEEDKWMGLSDFLLSGTEGAEKRKAKMFTKQEVLDFIRENQVEISPDPPRRRGS